MAGRFQRIQHLRQYPGEKEALLTLKQVASAVEPIMRARGWEIPVLAEFLPERSTLEGLSHGSRIIWLLLRDHEDTANQFQHPESVMHSLLHELCHSVHKPHDAAFWALFEVLADEWEALVRAGRFGDNYLGPHGSWWNEDIWVKLRYIDLVTRVVER